MAKKKNKDTEEQDVDLQDQVAEQEQNVELEEGEGQQDSELSQIAELEAEKAELKDKQLRLLAEFENYKKRTVKEKIDLMSNAAKDTISKLLPVLDDFDRAKKISDDEGSEEVFPDGVTMVYNKLHTTLKGLGLSVMELSLIHI